MLGAVPARCDNASREVPKAVEKSGFARRIVSSERIEPYVGTLFVCAHSAGQEAQPCFTAIA